MEEVKYILVFGVLHSSTYLVFSLGFSLIFGVARLPNVAYGALYVFSGYLSYTFFNYLNMDLTVSVLLSIAVTGVISMAIGELAIKPALKAPVSVFITTVAVAYILEEFFKAQMGMRPITLPLYPGTTRLLDIPVSNHWLLVAGFSIIMNAALILFLFRTSMGRSIRAVAESWEESMRLGIDPLKVLRMTLLVTGVYAGLTGVLLAPLKALTPTAGWSPLFAAFAIVVMGGVGNIIGTTVASVIYGLAEQAVVYLLGGGIARIVPLILIVLALTFRPHGIFGRGE